MCNWLQSLCFTLDYVPRKHCVVKPTIGKIGPLQLNALLSTLNFNLFSFYHLRYDIISSHIRNSAKVRRWFALNVILNPPNRLAEYILIAPAQEVRVAFVKLVAFCCLCSGKDDPLPDFSGESLCEQILHSALQLLKREVAENGKHLQHYFTLFSLFIGTIKQSKRLLLRVSLMDLFYGFSILILLTGFRCNQ